VDPYVNVSLQHLFADMSGPTHDWFPRSPPDFP